jgi:pimeloyl-ACP methyl ester carboxylesterase
VREQVARDASASLAVIQQCGHVCNVEQPELFNRTTLDFIARQTSSTHPK